MARAVGGGYHKAMVRRAKAEDGIMGKRKGQNENKIDSMGTVVRLIGYPCGQVTWLRQIVDYSE